MAGTLAAFVGLVKTESKEESKTRKIATYNCNGLAGILKKNMDGTKSTKQVKNNCLEVFIQNIVPIFSASKKFAARKNLSGRRRCPLVSSTFMPCIRRTEKVIREC